MEKKVTILRHPPLIEAALSIVADMPMLKMEDIGCFVTESVPDFKLTRELVQQTFTLEPGTISSPSSPTPTGRQYTKDTNLVLMIQNRSANEVEFVFSVLPPYTRWEDLYRIASPIFRSFVETFHVSQVKRIAIRSINRLFAPYDGCLVSDIIKTIPPDVGDLSTPFVQGFTYQDMMYYKDFDLYANIIRVTSPVPNDPRFSVVFDSDVSTPPMRSYPIGDIQKELDKIVELKDIVFFNSIGDKCMEKLK